MRRVMSVRDTEVAFASDREAEKHFERAGEGRYLLNIPALSTDLEVTHVQYERRGCYALLTVRTGLTGVRSIDGVLFHAAVNLASIRDRETIAKALQTRTAAARVETARWLEVVDELAVRVFRAEQVGAPSVYLSDVVPQPSDEWHWAYGFTLPRRHPAMIFGDGDTLKTYTANAIAVELARQDIRVGIVDWEMTDEEHRARVARLDTRQMDKIRYIPCVRPLIYERDRIIREVHEQDLQYLIFDSVAFACHDKPESADAAMVYFREVRSLRIGTLHLAHMSKGEQGDQKPFGSTFWFNAVRALWFAKRAEPGPDASEVEVGFYPRKFNLGRPSPPFGMRFAFTEQTTDVHKVDVAEVESLARNLSLRERIRHLLKSKGSMTVAEIAEELGEKPNSVTQSIGRAKSLFTRIEGPGETRFGLSTFRRVK